MPRVTKHNIVELQKQLLNWFAKYGRIFPRREEGMTSYQLIVAEVLLQRTTAETVARFYSNFIMDFPNWQSIAQANTGEIEEYLHPIGLYRRKDQTRVTLQLVIIVLCFLKPIAKNQTCFLIEPC